MLKKSVEYEVWRRIMGAPLTDKFDMVVDEERVAVGELESVGSGLVNLRETILKKEFANEANKLNIDCDWSLLEVRTRPFPRG